MNWDLKDFYNGFDDPLYQKDVDELERLVQEYIKLVGSTKELTELGLLKKYIVNQELTVKVLRTLFAYNSLINATDVTNQQSLLNMSKLQNIINKTTAAEVVFVRYLEKIDLDLLAAKDEIIKKNLFYLNKIKKSAQYLLTEKEEVMYAKLSQLASDSWDQVQSLLTANVDVSYEDKIITLSEVRNLAYDNSQVVRKKAFDAEMKAYKQIDDMVAMSLSNIKREVTVMNELRGYKDALEHTLIRSNMKRETLDAMIQAMKESRPIFEKYFLAKAKSLGHQNGLPFYELFAPVGKLDKDYTYEEAKTIVNDSFYGFSKRLGDFSSKAFNLNWIDPFPKKGKRGGAFCSNQPQIKQSRILSNFTGSLSDVSTLAHELGHGYHGEIICNNSPLQWSYPMPLAETASIFCETIVTKHLLADITDPQERLSVLEVSLQGDSQVIIDILSRFIFEQSIFDLSTGPISKEQMNELMINAQKEAYGKGLDANQLHPYMWLNKGHYYGAGLNFYNFPYAFGLLFGKGLYAKYLTDKESFLTNYDSLLALTTKASVEDVAASMGIDVTKPEFWRQSLSIVAEDINEVIKLLEK